MTNKKSNRERITWILYELDEAKEHLESLIKELSENEVISDEEFRIYMGHIYAHLNRAWNSRNQEKGISDENWEIMSKFPSDLEPVG